VLITDFERLNTFDLFGFCRAIHLTPNKFQCQLSAKVSN
jgi:hypothetical protein